MALRVEASAHPSHAPSELIRLGFAQNPPTPGVFHLALPSLSPELIEQWCGAKPAHTERLGAWTMVHDGQCAMVFGALDNPADASLAEAVETAYRQVGQWMEARGYAHPLKIWQYFSRINEGSGDAERYRQFCLGRSASGFARFAGNYPAATAIGSPWPFAPLQIVWMAAKTPGRAVENPRQTSAWQYPKHYGPVAPEFSRALVWPAQQPQVLLISGTASVRGHATVHDDTGAQLEELIANLQSLVHAANAELPIGANTFDLRRGGVFRVYLRHPDEAPRVLVRLREVFGEQARLNIVQGDVCRRDLKVEVDGVVFCC